MPVARVLAGLNDQSHRAAAMSIDVNEYGDLVLTEAGSLRASAEPGRLDLFDELSRHGPMNAEALAERLGTNPATTLDALRELAVHGLVEGSADVWRTTGKGIFFEIPDDPEVAAAARALSNLMLGRYADLPRRWIADDEPGLDLDWARAAG